jgi:hypothetical protein
LTNVLEQVAVDPRITGDRYGQYIIYECTQCPREFPTPEAFNAHRVPVHGPQSDSNLTTRVIYTQSDTSAFRRPLATESSLQKFFFCTKCPKRLGTYSSWRKHYFDDHGSTKDVRPRVELVDMDVLPIQLFECVDCGADFLTQANLSGHHNRVHQNLPHDLGRHHMLKAGYKFVCLVTGCGWSFVRFASLKYHNSKWHPTSTIQFEYKRCDQPNDPNMTISSAQPSDWIVTEEMVIEDSQSDEGDSDEDDDTADAFLATEPNTVMTSGHQDAPPWPVAIQLPLELVCPPRPSPIRVRRFRFEPIGVVPWPASKLNRRIH